MEVTSHSLKVHLSSNREDDLRHCCVAQDTSIQYLAFCYFFPSSERPNMSGVKRTIDEMDPDYEEISVVHTNKHHKASEQSGTYLFPG